MPEIGICQNVEHYHSVGEFRWAKGCEGRFQQRVLQDIVEMFYPSKLSISGCLDGSFG